MYCNYCRATNANDSLFCRSCGKSIAAVSPSPSEPTRQAQEGVEAALAEVQIGRPQPNGVGGWLALLVFGLLIGGPIALLAGIAQNPSPTVIFVSVVFGAWSVYCGIYLARQKPNAPRITKIFFIALFCFYALAIAVFILMDATKPGSFDVDTATGRTLGTLLSTIGWYAYLRKSKRVKNTYSRSSFTV